MVYAVPYGIVQKSNRKHIPLKKGENTGIVGLLIRLLCRDIPAEDYHQGLAKLHENCQIPFKKSKYHPFESNCRLRSKF
jgi:hypothetical protein